MHRPHHRARVRLLNRSVDALTPKMSEDQCALLRIMGYALAVFLICAAFIYWCSKAQGSLHLGDFLFS